MTSTFRLTWDRKFTLMAIVGPAIAVLVPLLSVFALLFILMVAETGFGPAAETWAKWAHEDQYFHAIVAITLLCYLPLPYALNLKFQSASVTSPPKGTLRLALRAALQSLLYLFLLMAAVNLIGRIFWNESMNGSGHPRLPYEALYLALFPIGVLWFIECLLACLVTEAALKFPKR